VPLNGFALAGGKNCFHSLAAHPFQGQLELLANFRYLLQHSRLRGQQDLLNQLDVFELSPLAVAVCLGHVELVREMLDAGADPNLGHTTSVNWAYLFLKRLQKAPTQPFTPDGGASLSRREARWLQEDYKSIITLLKQYGGQEVRYSNGMIQLAQSQFYSAHLRAAKQNWDESYQLGKEHGRQVYLQQGFRELLRQMWKPELPGEIKNGQPGYKPGNLFSIAKQSIGNSHKRYQADRAARNRFSSYEGVSSSQLSDNSSIGGELGGLMVRTLPQPSWAGRYTAEI
jgi:hypothetical protein